MEEPSKTWPLAWGIGASFISICVRVRVLEPLHDALEDYVRSLVTRLVAAHQLDEYPIQHGNIAGMKPIEVDAHVSHGSKPIARGE
jgi:hypothetical protein